jgi:HK97 family phage prohead protease
MEVPDFSGWASKNDLLCSDGRILRDGAFKHQNGQKVPLVWQHQYDSPENVLGHAFLEDRPEGVYARAYFNNTPAAESARQLVVHGDVNGLSIFANRLVQKRSASGVDVTHGDIKELSLVLAGANPGALIDSINLAHGDGIHPSDDEAIITTGEALIHGDLFSDDEGEPAEVVIDAIETAGESQEREIMGNQQLEHADGTTVEDVFNSMTQEQQDVVDIIVNEAIKNAGGASLSQSDIKDITNITTDELVHQFKEGFNVARNEFQSNSALGSTKEVGPSLSHDQLKTIVDDAQKFGSLKESFLAHAGDYGIDDIDLLFPDAKNDGNGISFIKRRTEWVANVLDGVKHSPFSRIKSLAADITADEARAKGYVKGNLKKDEVIKLLKRVTTPKTVYKKQKLDRDDIVDITEIDIIVWLKGEMRLMLDEEIATAILVGDGREPDDDDKIDEDHLRPIAFDVDMYNTVVELDANPTPSEMIEAIVRSRKSYKGTGTPTFYTTDDVLTDLILDKDTLGRRFYATETELSAALRVKEIVTVEAMERVTDIVGVLVNLTDYTVGADKGGEINTFDDFDIDYNQQKYLIETRISGALTKPKAAVTIKYYQGSVITPNQPSFVEATGVVTIPTQTGVVYRNDDTNAVLTAGPQTALAPGATLNVEATPATGYSFPHDYDGDWGFTRPRSA